MVSQPGAEIGQRVYCPVSGVVFEVTAATPHREVSGEKLFFCCESCAQHFVLHSARIMSARGL